MLRLTGIFRLTIAAIFLALPNVVGATIEIGGTEPMTNQDWPAGALEVANDRSRMHLIDTPVGCEMLYEGDAKALNDVLAKFAKIQAPELVLVIHAGVTSFDPGAGSGFAADNRVAWSFSVCGPSDYYEWHSEFRPRDSQPSIDGDQVPPPSLYVWPATPGLDWAKVHVPAGLTVKDERAIGHGYKLGDGAVITGVAYDMMTSKPVPHCQAVAERFVVTNGKANYSEAAHAAADAGGHFEMKNVPTGYYFILLRTPGYATRMIGRFDCQPGAYQSYVARLLPAIIQTGVVLAKNEKPIANLTIRAGEVTAIDNSVYSTSTDMFTEVTTDAAGRFTFADFPAGVVKLAARTSHEQTYHPLGIVGISTNALKLTYSP